MKLLKTKLLGESLHKALTGALLQDTKDGVVVLSIKPDSAAEKIVLFKTDIINGVNRTKIKNIAEFNSYLKGKQGVFALNILRNNSQLYLMVILYIL
jgi:S1-C subfamily serine protease